MSEQQYSLLINQYSRHLGLRAGASKITLERAEKLVDKLIEWYDQFEVKTV